MLFELFMLYKLRRLFELFKLRSLKQMQGKSIFADFPYSACYGTGIAFEIRVSAEVALH